MPLILLPGLGQTAASWQKVHDALTVKTDQTTLDYTMLPLPSPLTYSALYTEVSRTCQQHKPPLDLCGLSLGAVLALHYATDHPQEIRSLTLVNGQYRMPTALLRCQNFIFHCLPHSVFQGFGFQKKDVISLTQSMMHLDFQSDLAKLSCPTLIISGSKDRANRPAARRLTQLIPNSHFTEIEGGHELNQQAPQALSQALEEFLTSIT